jgi:CubicO group peptidase (beta-lactamase class C family)
MKQLLILLLLASCSSTNNKELLEVMEMKLPTGWTRSENQAFNYVVAPEKDFKLYFFKEKVSKDFSASNLSLKYWKKIDPNFNIKEVQNISPPSTNWDKVTQILYQVPREEERVALTLIRIQGDIAYINILNTGNATLSKRGAQMSQLIESWKPKATIKEDYSKVTPTQFHHIQAELEEFIKKSIGDLQAPGLAIGIVQNGKTVYQKGFGTTSIKNGKEVDPQTLFMIGSTTKPLTTLLMSKLIYEKKMTWNDRINKYLPNWTLKDKNISKQFLMKHSACACTGMPRRDLDFIFNFEGVSSEFRMNEMSDMNPTTKTGETFQYSNYLVATGGFAAARVYNTQLPLLKSYEKAMSELVFKPLNMKRTMVHNKSPYVINSALPHAYDDQSKTQRIPNILEEFATAIAPAGSIWSSAEDMTQYLKLELSNGQSVKGYIDEKNILLRRKKGVAMSEKSFYGLGLMIQDYKGIELVMHGGNTIGFTSEMFFLPKHNIGVSILVNLAGANALTAAIRAKLFELIFPGLNAKSQESIDFYKKYTQKNALKLGKSIKKPIKNKEKFVGLYNSKILGKMTISLNQNKLIANFGEFKTELKEKIDPSKNRVLLMMSPPWSGSMSLMEEKDGFSISSAQKKYLFKRN